MNKNHHTHLTISERREIYLLLARKMAVGQIALRLGRHHSTIYRELQRNSSFHEDHAYNAYYPVNAQVLYRQRRQSLQVLERRRELRHYVIARLKDYWSPEQIAGYLKRRGDERFYACSETIYRFVYSDEGRNLGLYRYLFKGRRNRRRMFSRKPRALRIPEHHGIAFRPAIITERTTSGHWEGDLMIFNREHGKSNLVSLVERKSRYTVLAKSPDRRPVAVIGKIREKLQELPNTLHQTITFDRGLEFMAYPLLRESLGMESYFCDPQAPWQKGSVESNNNRIRRFFPRELNLASVADADIYAVCVIMNNTPRKCLGYRTPQEVMDEDLQLAA